MIRWHRHQWSQWEDYNGDIHTLQRKRCLVCKKLRTRVP